MTPNTAACGRRGGGRDGDHGGRAVGGQRQTADCDGDDDGLAIAHGIAPLILIKINGARPSSNNADVFYNRRFAGAENSSKCLKNRNWLAGCRVRVGQGAGSKTAGREWRRSMAHLDLLEKRTDADLASLYWWRRRCRARGRHRRRQHGAGGASYAWSRAERAAPTTPAIVDLPGNRMRANAACTTRPRGASAERRDRARSRSSGGHPSRAAQRAGRAGDRADRHRGAGRRHDLRRGDATAGRALLRDGRHVRRVLRALSRAALVPADALRRAAEHPGVTHAASHIVRFPAKAGTQG